jgi:hypothetical protein
MNVTNPFTSLLALTGVALVFAGARRHWDQEDMYVGGFFTVVLALSVASFVIAPVYFHRYASFLAPSAAVLGGLGMRWITQQPWMRSPAPVALLLALAAGSQLVADGLTVRRMHHRRQLELARAIRETVPRSASIYSLEPGWLILANRLPDGQEGILGGWPGFQLPAFARAWRKSLSPQTRQQAFTIGWHDSQQFLDSYQFLATGNWSVPERIRGWLGREWVQRYPGAGKQGFALWQRR